MNAYPFTLAYEAWISYKKLHGDLVVILRIRGDSKKMKRNSYFTFIEWTGQRRWIYDYDPGIFKCREEVEVYLCLWPVTQEFLSVDKKWKFIYACGLWKRSFLHWNLAAKIVINTWLRKPFENLVARNVNMCVRAAILCLKKKLLFLFGNDTFWEGNFKKNEIWREFTDTWGNFYGKIIVL